MTKSWPKFGDYIQLESKYTNDLVRKYLAYILNSASLIDIKTQDNNELLSAYIAEMEDFQVFSETLNSQAQVDEILRELNVKFTKLLPVPEDKHLFNLIHQYNLYFINSHMVNLMIKFSADSRNKSLEGFEIGHYTFIKSFGDEKILSYITSHINDYVSNVVLELESNVGESESSVLAILRNPKIRVELKRQVIKKQEVRIQAIGEVEETSLWAIIVQENKMVPTWHNVTTYFQQEGDVDEILSGYLNLLENYMILEEGKVVDDTDISSEEINIFYERLFTSNFLNEEALQHLIKSISHKFKMIDLEGVSNQRVDLLLNNDFFEMTKENYDLLKKSHSGKNIQLLEHYEAADEEWFYFEFDAHDYELLFRSKVFSLVYKFIIAENMPLAILQKSKEVADILCELYANHSQKIPDELFNAMITNSRNKAQKVQMVILQVDNFSKERYHEVLPLLGAEYQSILEE